VNDGSDALIEGRLQHAFTRTRTILEGLTDDEFFWEPVERCWSVRPHAEVAHAWGAGEWRCEDVWPAPEPPPITTIGWRLVHLAAWTDIYRSFAFEDGTESLLQMDVPGTATVAVAWLELAQDRFVDALARRIPRAFDELRPAHWGELMPLSSLVGIIELEHIHHGAEISLLRDLHRGSAQTMRWPLLPR
jgi:hypothetical protein